jgi:hypothetical protein
MTTRRRQRKVLFGLGQTYATPAALACIQRAQLSVHDLLAEHQAGIWGDIDEEDAKANEHAVKTGARILSMREFGGERAYIITEAEDDDGVRSATTILLCQEY